MNVNCEKSEELFNNNNDKFGNLRLGQQLMNDIKKMLTHPMRNPYDKTITKSNLIVMQEYKPPAGQIFPNGALLAGPDRTPNNIYVPAKIQQSYDSISFGNEFAASTPNYQYVPPYNAITPSQKDAEVFQRQRQNGQYQQNSRLQSTQTAQTANGHAGQFTQTTNAGLLNNFNSQGQYNPRQTNFATQSLNSQNAVNTQRGQLSRQNGQYTDNSQRYNYNQNLPLINEDTRQVNNEAQQNSVSNDIPATIITKTLTFNRIADPKPGTPKSRITLKTWIVKPSKAARLIANPTPYTYDRPTNPPTEKLVEATPYVYNPPTTQTERIVSESDNGYSYNKPTVAAKQVVSTVRQPQRLYLTPSSPPPTLASRLYLSPSSAPPTVASRLYIPPTTYKPANLYLPPSQSNLILSRQYLSPTRSAIQQQKYYQNEKLQASPTSPAPVFLSPTKDTTNNPSFSVIKQSRINTNHNNLTFADILTKEKLDITVNDIVSDTSKLLKTASPQQHLDQYRQDKTVDYSDSENNYISSDINNESDENLTPQSPTVVSKSSRLTGPSRQLEPPIESYNNNQNNHQNSNPLSNLPYFMEPPANTIERTVSLKISIPEKLATYLFKNKNESVSDYDKLEILNTGSSNYLVLTNNLIPKTTGASFIPIGKLIADKNTSISNSQALVFSFLTDSINTAKEYGDIVKQNIVYQTPQYQNVNNEELSRITNQVSQLTASQYSNNENNNFNRNIVSNPQTTTNSANIYRPAKYTNNFTQNQQQIQRTQINSPSRQISPDFLQYQSNGQKENLQINDQNIYSGQFYKYPVPDVTSQIYNVGSANLVQTNNVRQNSEAPHLNAVNQNSGANNNLGRQSSTKVEIVQSRTLPVPAKLQFAPSNEPETFNSQEHSTQTLLGNFLNNGNGISAQLKDKIIGTIPHPLEENKLVTYKKDHSYYVYTKLNNQNNNVQENQRNANLVQNNAPNILAFQFVPSLSYKLENENDQQNILNTFQIDEYGNPKKVNRGKNIMTSDVDYSIQHPTSAKQVDGQTNDANTIYAGPSSYSAPQASVGSLQVRNQIQNNFNSRLELQDSSNGYSNVTPERQFTY